MDLKYEYFIYIGAFFVIAMAVLFIVFPAAKRGSYKIGKKIAGLEYVQDTQLFKIKKVLYPILLGTTLVGMIGAMMFSVILGARPYEYLVTEEERYSRDIIICMDISTSVDDLNASLMKQLKNTVKELEGERIGVVIFNTTPVVLCPLTEDYEYVLEVLDNVQKGLEARNNLLSDFYYDYDEAIYYDDYISSGTIIGNEIRGSSLIGDGLAAAAYTFPMDDPDRSKVIIFTTDNDPYGESILELPEATDVCIKRNIIVYGIGTSYMIGYEEDEMRECMEKTGGKYYRENQSGNMDEIVSDIQEMSGAYIGGIKDVREVDHPELFFGWILAFVIITIGSARILKL